MSLEKNLFDTNPYGEEQLPETNPFYQRTQNIINSQNPQKDMGIKKKLRKIFFTGAIGATLASCAPDNLTTPGQPTINPGTGSGGTNITNPTNQNQAYEITKLPRFSAYGVDGGIRANAPGHPNQVYSNDNLSLEIDDPKDIAPSRYNVYLESQIEPTQRVLTNVSNPLLEFVKAFKIGDKSIYLIPALKQTQTSYIKEGPNSITNSAIANGSNWPIVNDDNEVVFPNGLYRGFIMDDGEKKYVEFNVDNQCNFGTAKLNPDGSFDTCF